MYSKIDSITDEPVNVDCIQPACLLSGCVAAVRDRTVPLVAIVQHYFPAHVDSVISLDCFQSRLYDKLCE